MPRFDVRIRIALLPEILDPAGLTVLKTLQRSGYDQVRGLRFSKLLICTIEAKDQTDAHRLATRLCEKVLVNPASELGEIESIVPALPSDS